MPNSNDSTEPVWRLLRIECDLVDVEVISDVLWTRGAAAVEECPSDSGRVVLRTHLADTDIIERLQARFSGIVISVDEVPTRVSETWRIHASPTHVVDDMWLVPEWCTPPPESRAIIIEPGATFGLGDHPTTVLALRAALRASRSGERIHDHGTGSGVLAIAMILWRGATVSTDDIAPESRGVVEANAHRNAVAAPLWSEGLPSKASLDGLVANILAPVLRENATHIESIVRSGGWIVLSGIRRDQLDSVVSRYVDSDTEAVEEIDGWVGVLLRRR